MHMHQAKACANCCRALPVPVRHGDLGAACHAIVHGLPSPGLNPWPGPSLSPVRGLLRTAMAMAEGSQKRTRALRPFIASGGARAHRLGGGWRMVCRAKVALRYGIGRSGAETASCRVRPSFVLLATPRLVLARGTVVELVTPSLMMSIRRS